MKVKGSETMDTALLKEKIQKLVHEKLLTSSAEDTEDWMKNIS